MSSVLAEHTPITTTSVTPPVIPTEPTLFGTIKPENLEIVERLRVFLVTAPQQWTADQTICRFSLPNNESISCVLWNGIFYITGTDIVRALTFRFEAMGRIVKNQKKFEEGIFSDLRNLKPGTDASLEEPRSEFLEFLYKNNCIRTQKKQKVFYWFSVPHDQLFMDALERDLKREAMGAEPSTQPSLTISNHPATLPTTAMTPILPFTPMPGMMALQNETIMSNSPMLQMKGLSAAADPMMMLPIQPNVSMVPELLPFPGSAANADFAGSLGNTTYVSDNEPLDFAKIANASQRSQKFKHHRSSSVGSVSSFVSSVDSASTRTAFDSPLIFPADDELELGNFDTLLLDDTASVGSGSLENDTFPLTGPRRRSALSQELYNHNNTVSAAGGHFTSSKRKFSAPAAMGSELGSAPTSPTLLPIRSSVSERQYACDYQNCNKVFKRFEHLRRHMRGHIGEKPYSCNVCDKAFTRSDSLNSHLRSHELASQVPNYEQTPEMASLMNFSFPQSLAGSGSPAAPSKLPALASTFLFDNTDTLSISSGDVSFMDGSPFQNFSTLPPFDPFI